MLNNLKPFIQEYVTTNKVLHRILVVYSLILVLFGGQLSATYHFVVTTIVTVGFTLYLAVYQSLNTSEEFNGTLPGFNKYARKARVIAGTLITFPFYAMTSLAIFRQLSVDQGQVFPVRSLTVYSLIVMGFYLFVSRKLVAAEKTVVEKGVFRNLRMIALVCMLAVAVILLFAFYKNYHFYGSIKQLENPQVTVPESWLNVEEGSRYHCDNPDRILINCVVTNCHKKDMISYCDSHIIDFPMNGQFGISLGKLPNSPKRFEKILLKIGGGNIWLHNMNKLTHKHDGYHFATTQSKFFPKSYNILELKADYAEVHLQDPWYRRLFNVMDYSIYKDQVIEFYSIAYNSKEKLVKVDADKIPRLRRIRYSSYMMYDGTRTYLSKMRQKIAPITETTGWKNTNTPHASSYTIRTQAPINFIGSLKTIYLLLTLLLLLGFIWFRFELSSMFVLTIAVICSFIAVDRGLAYKRLELIESQPEGLSSMLIAADLNNSIYHRRPVQKELSRIYGKSKKINSRRRVFKAYKNSWLMLLNRKNVLLDEKRDSGTFEKSRIFYYGYADFRDIEVGKIIPSSNHYIHQSKRYDDHFAIEFSTHFTRQALIEARTWDQSDKEQKFKSLEGLSLAEKEERVKSDKILFSYILLRKFDITVESVMGEDYVTMIDEVIEIDEAKQLELVLEYLNKEK